MNTLEKASSPNQDDWPIFSYSQLQVWDRCEYQWYLGYEQEWTKKEKSGALNIGSLVHKYLEIHYLNVVQTSGKTWDLIEDEIAKDIQIAVDSNNTSALNEVHRAGVMVKMYVHEYAPFKDAGISILDVEKHFMIPYTTPYHNFNFFLQGYIDLQISHHGKVWIWDHKTTSNAGFWKPVEVQMDPQMTLYQAGLKRLGIPVHGVVYNFLNSYDYKNMKAVGVEKLFKREETYRSPIEVENFEYQLLLEIEKLILATGDKDYHYHRSLRRDCANCTFQEPCLFGLKGIDPQPILITKFKKKDPMPVGIRPGSI